MTVTGYHPDGSMKTVLGFFLVGGILYINKLIPIYNTLSYIILFN